MDEAAGAAEAPAVGTAEEVDGTRRAEEAAAAPAAEAAADAAGEDAADPAACAAGAGALAEPAPPQPSKPLSWAERAALAAANAAAAATAAAPASGAAAGYHASSSSTAPAAPRTALLEDVKVVKDSVVDYLIFLVERREAQAAGEPAPECPEALLKFEGALGAAIPTSAAVTHARLGLTNSANNCYVSVVVQSLLPCSALMWVLRRCSANDPRRPVFSCMVSLCKEFHTRKPDAQGEVLNYLVLQPVKEVVASWQRLGAQHDAGEFLFWLLSQLHDESKWKVHSLSAGSDGAGDCAALEGAEDDIAWATLVRTNRRACETRVAGFHEESPITRIFGGTLESAVRSKGAKVDSVSLEPFNHLVLDISDTAVSTVKDALRAFCGPEEVNDGQATRQIHFKQLPKVLILNLKRFTYVKGKGGPQKIHKAIRYDEKLVLDPGWLAAGTVPQEYLMTAVICHHGETVSRGHYTAIVRYNSEWYLYDDTCVRKVELKEVGAQHHTAYLVVYQSRGAVHMAP